MGRLPPVERLRRSGGSGAFACVALILVLGACDEDPKHVAMAPAERSQAVQGTSTATTPNVAPAASPRPSAGKRAQRAPLCGGALDPEGRAAPKKAIARRAAPGESELPDEPSFSGDFTWVNFWAAWCVPCREEIPRLLGWQERLRGQGKRFRVMFVSLDDDARQLERFLSDQTPAGLRRTYWLREGQEREAWLDAAGIDRDPDLPVHLLVDGKGKTRCRIRGAVEDADFETLVALLGP